MAFGGSREVVVPDIAEGVVEADSLEAVVEADGPLMGFGGGGKCLLGEVFEVGDGGWHDRLLAEFDLGGPLTALILSGFGDGGNMGVGAEKLTQGAAEDAHAGAVNHPDTR